MVELSLRRDLETVWERGATRSQKIQNFFFFAKN
jgi:hypothetical protein